MAACASYPTFKSSAHIPSHPSAKVEVKPSLIPGAGLGVFATRDISPGEEITNYIGSIVSKSTIDEYPDLIEYAQQVGDGSFCIVGDKSACNVLDGVGHLINDGYMPSIILMRWLKLSNILHNPVGLGLLSAITYSYYCVSTSKSNCISIDDSKTMTVKMFATRHIKKGDELYYSYSMPYWEASVVKNHPEVKAVPPDLENLALSQANQVIAREYEKMCRYLFWYVNLRRGSHSYRKLTPEQLKQFKDNFTTWTAKCTRVKPQYLTNLFHPDTAEFIFKAILSNMISIGMIKPDDLTTPNIPSDPGAATPSL
jgi:hypothetical protein